MPSDLPQTPQSPSYDSTYFPSKLAASPRTGSSLPTPAHSINGSMSSTTPDVVAEAAHVEDPSNKRKRDIEDGGDRDQKKVHLEDSRLRIEDLHLDVGEKYLLCRTRKTPFFLRDMPSLRLAGHNSYPKVPPHIINSTWLTWTLMRSSSAFSNTSQGRSLPEVRSN